VSAPTHHDDRILVEPLGDTAIIVRFGATIDRTLNDRALALAESLVREPLPAQCDVAPAFASLAVTFAWRDGDRGAMRADAIRRLSSLARTAIAPARAPRHHEIPVCYDRSLAPDLDAVASHASLDVERLIALHAAPTYRVFMIGFTPGFPYLGELDERLAMPRRATPRARVPALSVAIGGAHTGIYPMESPGGWWIIGRTPTTLFDPALSTPSTLEAGDLVRFRAVTLEEYRDARGASTR
jgi:inhibitor of KinA